MKFLVGAVREPSLRVDFHGKACGYRKYHWNTNPFNLSEQLTMTSKKCRGSIPHFLLTAHGSLLTLMSQ
jgi:hypothetical protein